MTLTDEQLLERAARRRIEPDRALLRRAIVRARMSHGAIGRSVAEAVGKSPEAARVKIAKFFSKQGDRTMSVGFHEAVVGALIDGLADRNGGAVLSEADRALTEALALDRMRAEADEELRELEAEIIRHETALDMAQARQARVLADREEIVAAMKAAERAAEARV